MSLSSCASNNYSFVPAPAPRERPLSQDQSIQRIQCAQHASRFFSAACPEQAGQTAASVQHMSAVHEQRSCYDRQESPAGKHSLSTCTAEDWAGREGHGGDVFGGGLMLRGRLSNELSNERL